MNKVKGLNHLEEEDEEIDSRPTDLTIYEEEAILKLMDKQELGLKVGENHNFVLAQRSDINKKTGRPKYIPVEACKDNCSINTSQDKDTRNIYSNPDVVHNLTNFAYLNLDVLNITDRKKRSTFTDGLLNAGGKLLDGNPGGFFVEMLKTIAKPVYNWVIGTDNDEVMKKFLHQMDAP